MNPAYLSTKKIQQARAEGKWLMWLGDTSVMFSPDELEKKQAAGDFCHGEDNFVLFDPMTLIDGIDKQIAEKLKEKVQLMKRMGLPVEDLARL